MPAVTAKRSEGGFEDVIGEVLEILLGCDICVTGEECGEGVNCCDLKDLQ